MNLKFRMAFGVLAAGALLAGTLGAASGSAAATTVTNAPAKAAVTQSVPLHLTASSPQVAACLPKANVNVKVELKTDQIGFDDFHINATGLRANTAFTVFLLQQADAPFGAAEYIGDVFTDKNGNANNAFHVIVAEAFSSNLLNGQRVRTELNQVGMWFADPAGDDFCLGKNKGPVTPFDGDDPRASRPSIPCTPIHSPPPDPGGPLQAGPVGITPAGPVVVCGRGARAILGL